MKKIVSLILSVVFLSMMALNAFALTGVQNGEQYTYTFEDGTTVNYYLDEWGMPYRIADGEKIYIAIALDHLEIEDTRTINKLNLSKENNNSVMSLQAAVPSADAFDMSKCLKTENSIKYIVENINVSGTFFTTKQFILNTGHSGMCVKTSDHSPLLGDKNVNITYYFYSNINERWYLLTMMDKDCTGSGYKFQHSPSIYPYGQIQIIGHSILDECDLTVYTGPFIPSGGKLPIY